MLSNTLGILLLVPFFAGIGLLFPWNLFQKRPGFERLLLTFWTGWALAIAFVQVWHFIFKIDLIPLFMLLAASAAGWVRGRSQVTAWLKGLDRRSILWLVALALAGAVVLANHVMFIAPHYDHGLYHMQTITWFNQFAIVPGLGNLHHRLAFNNSNILLAAVFNSGFLAGRAYYISNPVLAYSVILLCGAGFYRLQQSDERRSQPLYAVFMLPFVLWQFSTTHLAGYSPDIPVFALQFVLAGEVLRLFEAGPDRAAFQRQMLFILLLVSAGLTVKLSFAVFGAAVLVVVGGLWLARFKPVFKAGKPGAGADDAGKQVLAWVAVMAAFMLPWVGRNLVLSGYPLYPAALAPIPFDWTMPDYLAGPVTSVITTWARTMSDSIEYTADLAWFGQWWRFFTYEAKQAFLLSLLLFALLGGLAYGLRRRAKVAAGPAALIIIAVVSILYWFAAAPDYRFSGAVFWILLVSLLLAIYRLLVDAGLFPASKWALLLVLLALTFWVSPNHFSKNLSRRYLISPPTEQSVAQQARPPESLHSKITDSGLEVYFPAGAADCWNFPLPCTPENDYNPRLSLIRDGELARGFTMLK